jgi:hypothetical protein
LRRISGRGKEVVSIGRREGERGRCRKEVETEEEDELQLFYLVDIVTSAHVIH